MRSARCTEENLSGPLLYIYVCGWVCSTFIPPAQSPYLVVDLGHGHYFNDQGHHDLNELEMTRTYRPDQIQPNAEGEHLILMIITRDSSRFSSFTLPTFSFELFPTLARPCFRRQLSFGRIQYREGRWYACIAYDMTYTYLPLPAA